jgi:hypothetical protein
MQKPWTVLASFTAATAVLCLSALTACGSSTAPSSPSFAEARHLDTLAQQAAAANEFDRFRLLQYPIALLAHGLKPESVTVSINGADQTFAIGALEMVLTTAGAKPTPNDSTYVVVAWQGADVSQLVYLVMDRHSTIFDEALLQDTTPNFNLTTADVNLSPAAASGACPTLKLDSPSNLINAKCTKATFTAAFDLTFVDPQTEDNLRYVLASQSIPAVRLLMTGSSGGQDIISDLEKGRPTVRR